jgi:FtsH-binding integral membrane protein
MDLESKFLGAFYGVLGVVASAILIAVLAGSAEVASMIVVVLMMFAAMGLMFATTFRQDGDERGDRRG